MKAWSILGGAAVSLVGSASLAQHAGDILLTVEGGRIRTSLTQPGGFVRAGERVFASEFGEIAPNFTDEPGFDNVPGTFTPGTSIGFRVGRGLRVFDAYRFDRMDGALRIEFGPLGVTTPASDQAVEGFTISVADNGEWHRHLEYTLESPATDGIYLLELQLFSTDPGVAASEWFWIVFNQSMPESAHEVAVRWARIHLALACVADYDDGTGTGTPDGGVTVDDLLFYLALYEMGHPLADTDDGTGTGVLDGGVTIDDMLYLIGRFSDGC